MIYYERVFYLKYFFFVGISDSMRNDFNLMKELASHTHIEPTPRYQALIDMVNTINT